MSNVKSQFFNTWFRIDNDDNCNVDNMFYMYHSCMLSVFEKKPTHMFCTTHYWAMCFNSDAGTTIVTLSVWQCMMLQVSSCPCPRPCQCYPFNVINPKGRIVFANLESLVRLLNIMEFSLPGALCVLRSAFQFGPQFGRFQEIVTGIFVPKKNYQPFH